MEQNKSLICRVLWKRDELLKYSAVICSCQKHYTKKIARSDLMPQAKRKFSWDHLVSIDFPMLFYLELVPPIPLKKPRKSVSMVTNKVWALHAKKMSWTRDDGETADHHKRPTMERLECTSARLKISFTLSLCHLADTVSEPKSPKSLKA